MSRSCTGPRGRSPSRTCSTVRTIGASDQWVVKPFLLSSRFDHPSRAALPYHTVLRVGPVGGLVYGLFCRYLWTSIGAHTHVRTNARTRNHELFAKQIRRTDGRKRKAKVCQKFASEDHKTRPFTDVDALCPALDMRTAKWAKRVTEKGTSGFALEIGKVGHDVHAADVCFLAILVTLRGWPKGRCTMLRCSSVAISLKTMKFGIHRTIQLPDHLS